MRSIADVIGQFKLHWTEHLDRRAIAEACQDARMRWLQSTLNPVVTVQIFFLQILHSNTACEHLPHLARIPFTAAAYCKARMRLELDALHLLPQRSVAALRADVFDNSRWLGHRVFLVDGSSFSMPDTPSCKPTLANRASSSPVAVFQRRIGWRCCTGRYEVGFNQRRYCYRRDH